jgi:glyceraldehyde 3-phosphate dehydrogenase
MVLGVSAALAFRQIYNMEGIEVVAINDLTQPKYLHTF